MESNVYFSEQVDLSEKFIEHVQAETDSIRMASHRLSDVKVIEALIQARSRGVDVMVIVDPVTVTRKSPLTLLLDADIPVYVWNYAALEKKADVSKHMHHSFCLFGKSLVWTGSFSFSLKRLFSHRESACVFSNTKIAGSFLREFNDIKTACSVPLALYRENQVKKIRN